MALEGCLRTLNVKHWRRNNSHQNEDSDQDKIISSERLGQRFAEKTSIISIAILKKLDKVLREKINMLRKEMK